MHSPNDSAHLPDFGLNISAIPKSTGYGSLKPTNTPTNQNTQRRFSFGNENGMFLQDNQFSSTAVTPRNAASVAPISLKDALQKAKKPLNEASQTNSSSRLPPSPSPPPPPLPLPQPLPINPSKQLLQKDSVFYADQMSQENPEAKQLFFGTTDFPAQQQTSIIPQQKLTISTFSMSSPNYDRIGQGQTSNGDLKNYLNNLNQRFRQPTPTAESHASALKHYRISQKLHEKIKGGSKEKRQAAQWVFCTVCEDYINSQLVDEHSRYCIETAQQQLQQTSLEEDQLRHRLEKTNEKLLKVKILLERMHVDRETTHRKHIERALDKLTSYGVKVVTQFDPSVISETLGRLHKKMRKLQELEDIENRPLVMAILALVQKLIEFTYQKSDLLDLLRTQEERQRSQHQHQLQAIYSQGLIPIDYII